MSLLSGGVGGFLVPYELDPAIVIAKYRVRRSDARGGAGRNDAIQRETVRNLAGGGERVVCGGGRGRRQLCRALAAGHRLQESDELVPASFELFEDSSIAAEVNRLFVDSKANEEARVFTTGTGTTEPKGLITALIAAGGATVIATGTQRACAGRLVHKPGGTSGPLGGRTPSGR